MYNIGSSIVSGLASGVFVKGSTGNTGATGPIGATGLGSTGNTGSSISNITLVDRYIITTFSDGSTYGTPSQAIGTTGIGSYNIKMSNIGTGISLGYSVDGITLQIRPIRFVNNTEGLLYIDITENTPTTIGNYYMHLQNTYAGITVTNQALSNTNLVTFNSSGKITRIPNTYGITWSQNDNRVSTKGIKFVSANIFELVRGGGWTGTTSGFNCISSFSGITCTINPFIKQNDGLMYSSSSRVYVADFRGSTGSIVVVNPPQDKNVYGFDLLLSNTLNPLFISDRFSSNIKWPLNRPPCFSFEGATCDIKISFFGFGGSTFWYASSMPSSSKCAGISLFDGNCKGASNFTSGSSQNTIPGDFGACCESNGTCTETYASNCVGYFHGIGTTCGNTYDSICDKIGACCVMNTVYSCYDYLTCTECLSLGVNSSVTTQFAGKYTTCLDVDCTVLSENYFDF